MIVELLLIAAKLCPADIAGVMILKHRWPVIALDLARVALDARRFAWQGPLPGLGASIHVRPGVERVVQDGEHPRVAQPPPYHLAFALALPQPIRDLQAMIGKVLYHSEGRLRRLEHREDLAHRVLDFLIGIERDT
jgi:hypothetical protein